MKSRLLAILLSLAMLIAMLPAQTLAAGSGIVLAQVTDVSVGEKEPWTYTFDLDITGVLNITIGECSPGWRYKIYYPDGGESVWFNAGKWSLNGNVQDLEFF